MTKNVNFVTTKCKEFVLTYVEQEEIFDAVNKKSNFVAMMSQIL
jgi:hypothetical protein